MVKKILEQGLSWPKNHKKMSIVLLLIILVIGGYFLFRPKGDSKVEYTQVKRQTVKSTVSASGVLTGKKKASLRFKGSGTLAYLNVAAGDQVQQGDLLAGLDTQQLAISLQQARNTLEARRAELRKVLDDIHLSQYGNGGFGNVGSANETEAQRQSRMVAEAAQNNAFDTVKEAERVFNDAVITSPLTGLVTKADFVPGQVVTAADIIIEVADESEIYFEAEVDEADIAQISVGQKAEITLNSYGDKVFYGDVMEILPVTKTTSSGATVVIARIKVYKEGLRFIANLNGQADIATAEKQQVLSVPQDAVRGDDEVLVKEGDKFKAVTFEKGISSDTEVEVLGGLQENQEVVLNPGEIDEKQIVK